QPNRAAARSHQIDRLPLIVVRKRPTMTSFHPTPPGSPSLLQVSINSEEVHPPHHAQVRGGGGEKISVLEHADAFSRRHAPEVCPNVPRLEIRGRRECRVRAAPAVSCARR